MNSVDLSSLTVIFLGILFPLLGWFFLKLKSSSRLKYSCILHFYIITLFFGVIPGTIVLLNIPFPGFDPSHNADALLYGDFDRRFEVWLTFLYLVSMTPFVYTILGNVCQPYNSNLKYDANINAVLKWYIVITIFLILLSFKNSPLFGLLSDGIDGYKNKRFADENNFSIFSTLSANLPILFTLLAFSNYLVEKTKQALYISLNCIGIYIIIALFAGSAGTFAFMAMALFVLYFIYSGIKVNLKITMGSIFLMFIMFIIFKVEISSDISLANYIIQRIFFDQSKGFYIAIEVFPNYVNHLGFKSTSGSFNNFFYGIGKLPDYGATLMEYFSLQSSSVNRSGHFTSIYPTEIYSNFGYSGILISPLYIAIILKFLDCKFKKANESKIVLAIYTYLIVFGLNLFNGFTQFYYPINTLIGLVVFCIIIKATHFFFK